MSAVKEALIKKIEQMSDAEARQVLALADQVQSPAGRSDLLEILRKDPLLRVPRKKFASFKRVEPLKGKGIPASKLLIADRR